MRYDWGNGTIDGQPAKLRRAKVYRRGEEKPVSPLSWVDTDKDEALQFIIMPDGTWATGPMGIPLTRLIHGDFLIVWEEDACP